MEPSTSGKTAGSSAITRGGGTISLNEPPHIDDYRILTGKEMCLIAGGRVGRGGKMRFIRRR